MGNWTQWRGFLRENEDPQTIGFWCPGCRSLHVYDERWKFDGNFERPTFTPSLRTTTGHYVTGAPRLPNGECSICVRAKERGVRSICVVCHLNVHAGQIVFHLDSTHSLRGQTVAMTKPQDG